MIVFNENLNIFSHKITIIYQKMRYWMIVNERKAILKSPAASFITLTICGNRHGDSWQRMPRTKLMY